MNKKGFTLVELLVVVAILGVLAAVGIVSFGGYLGKSKQVASKTNYKIVKDFIINEVNGCQVDRFPQLYNPDGTIKKPACPVHAKGSLEYFVVHFNYIKLKNPYNNNKLAVNYDCSNENGCIELTAPDAYKFIIKSY